MADVEVKIRIGDSGDTGDPVTALRHWMVQDIRPVGFNWGTVSQRVSLILRANLTEEEQAQLLEAEIIPNPDYDENDPGSPSDITVRRRKYIVDERELQNLIVNIVRQIEHLSFKDRDIGILKVGGQDLYRLEAEVKPRLASEVYGVI